jgi:hypothetical protein
MYRRSIKISLKESEAFKKVDHHMKKTPAV